jgi:hypothetical protein
MEQNPYEAPQSEPSNPPIDFTRLFSAFGWLVSTWIIVPLALAGIAAALAAITQSLKH